MKDHFALLPESGVSSMTVHAVNGGVWLGVLDDWALLTPAEARQIAAALNRAAALRPVPAA